MESLPLFKDKKEKSYFFISIFIIFCVNIYLHFIDYKRFTNIEVFQTDAIILNIYEKQKYNVLKLQTQNSDLGFTFFTSSYTNHNYKKLQNINLFIVTKDISFFQYLKGFYGKSFALTLLETTTTKKQTIYNYINSQHQNKDISSLYSALFLATNISQNIREVCSSFGISHLVAISGFHLGVISFVLYFLIHLIYKQIHQKYIPYRNKRFDILIVVSIILFSYLLFVDLVPSLLRAFVMFVFGLFLLRNNIKIFSFETLLIIVLFIIALFPRLLFSLSLWFSVTGVFYIFLFIHYFKNMNKYLQFLVFNFWIYFAMNPIVHYFFEDTSLMQLYSPILTLLFTIFYPLVAFLHLIQFGWLFDDLLLKVLDLNIVVESVETPLWFFIIYALVSFYSIVSKKGFIVLNIAFLLFSLKLYL
ncbi:MAG: ComEC/Rec2 family competence protein [Campylobacterota bacterium]|nr:ComEC/Rec2 family competence protein [Campylobacterota bacterium]